MQSKMAWDIFTLQTRKYWRIVCRRTIAIVFMARRVLNGFRHAREKVIQTRQRTRRTRGAENLCGLKRIFSLQWTAIPNKNRFSTVSWFHVSFCFLRLRGSRCARHTCRIMILRCLETDSDDLHSGWPTVWSTLTCRLAEFDSDRWRRVSWRCRRQKLKSMRFKDF